MVRYYVMDMTQTMVNEMFWFIVGLIAGALFMALIDFMIDRKVRNNGSICTDDCRKHSKRSQERDGRGTEEGNQGQHNNTKLDLHQFKHR